jgi:hypothetical protein
MQKSIINDTMDILYKSNPDFPWTSIDENHDFWDDESGHVGHM